MHYLCLKILIFITFEGGQKQKFPDTVFLPHYQATFLPNFGEKGWTFGELEKCASFSTFVHLCTEKQILAVHTDNSICYKYVTVSDWSQQEGNTN